VPHVGTCDEAIQEILAANLPPHCVVLLNNSSEATVSWYHDLKKFFVDLWASRSRFRTSRASCGRTIKPLAGTAGFDSDTGITASKHY